MKMCLGLILVMFCETEKPVTVSDFCQQTRQEVAALQYMTAAELATLKRSRKDAIASLRRKYRKHCTKVH